MRCSMISGGVCVLMATSCQQVTGYHPFPGEGGSAGDLAAWSADDSDPSCSTGDAACVPSADGPFLRITMISIGTPEEVMPCPPWAPAGFEGFADMTVAPHTCPACSCGPAACALPEYLHASAATCAGSSTVTVSWDALPAWEGGCLAESPIAAGLQCGNVDCVQSLTIESPRVEPCFPHTLGRPFLPAPEWGRTVRECKIDVDPNAADCPHGSSCAPLPPEGFRLCLSASGADYECPHAYPERFVVFDTVNDARACSPCACSDPEGAACSALVSVFADTSCSDFIGSFPVTSATDTGCFDLPPGTALGSKTATLTVDTLGTCAPSGGDPSGALEPVGPLTFCCQAEPEPAK